jgi:electron transfer flavoprotein alpha subunit
LVLADHSGGALAPSTLHSVAAAQSIGGDISVLVSGQGSADVAAEASQIDGVTRVLCADSPALANHLSENVASLLHGLAQKDSFTHILGSTSAVAKSTFPRLAALLDVGAITDVIGVESEDTFVRPTYAGNAICKLKSLDSVKVLTVRTTAFEAASTGSGNADNVEADSSGVDAGVSTWVSESLNKSERPELGSAKVVVSGGRGLGSKENFDMMYSLADKLGGAGECAPSIIRVIAVSLIIRALMVLLRDNCE